MQKPTAAAAGESIRRLRDLAGLTLDQAASSASVSVSYLSKVERGVEVASPAWIGHVTAAIAAHLIGASVRSQQEPTDALAS